MGCAEEEEDWVEVGSQSLNRLQCQLYSAVHFKQHDSIFIFPVHTAAWATHRFASGGEHVSAQTMLEPLMGSLDNPTTSALLGRPSDVKRVEQRVACDWIVRLKVGFGIAPLPM